MKAQVQGYNLDTVKQNNISLVVRLLHRARVCSRVDLSREAGLSQASITHIISFLIERGIVFETGSVEGKMGRRSIGVSLNTNYKIIGIRLERDYYAIGLFNIWGELLTKFDDYTYNIHEPHYVLEHLIHSISVMLEANTPSEILGIGVALPGPFISHKNKIEIMSGFPGWEDIDIAAVLRERFPLPIFLEHNANCGALAELWYGVKKNYRNAVVIAADVGVGSGIIIDGRLYRGAIGTSGEIGHMSIDYNGPKCECGNRGCLELYCSTKRLQREYTLIAKKTPGYEAFSQKDSKEILEAVAQGDSVARAAFQPIAEALGYGIVNIINVINPDIVIFSDHLALAGEYLIEIVRSILHARLLPTIFCELELKISSFADDCMLYGASALVLDKFLEQPLDFLKDTPNE